MYRVLCSLSVVIDSWLFTGQVGPLSRLLVWHVGPCCIVAVRLIYVVWLDLFCLLEI